ncbi:MAG: hypothetical protein IKF75_04005 [Lachnospiraceae bacterium]|nr:hypothetical protein [Lachnospiraceae bacterium]
MKNEKKSPETRTFSLRERFRYWFDNRMTGGSLGFIRFLIAASLLLALFMAALIILLGFSEEGETVSVLWDSVATVINAWMPSFEDGSPGYLILMSLTAIAGLLFTSVFIGIITSAIEEKIDSLKRGNSLVLEQDHIVVLGFSPGEYTLLSQLILAAAGKPACVVLAEDMDRADMEDDLHENLELPENFRIVCRTVDITDPASLEKCSVETCRTVIVSPADDMKTIKAILAVSALLEDKGAPEISVNAIISKNEHRFPPSIAETNNISTLQTSSILAKMIAHSCTQTGLSEAFREIFNFEGSEFYLIDLPGIGSLTFEDLSLRLDGASPAGIYRDGAMQLNPPFDLALREDDRVLVFSEESGSAKLLEAPASLPALPEITRNVSEKETGTVIIGTNETLPTILAELPENVSEVFLAGTHDEDRTTLEKAARKRSIHLQYCEGNPHDEEVLLALARLTSHIVVLGDHTMDPEEADMETILTLLNLRDIRKRYDLSFNITVEMQLEHNQRLVGRGDHTDFLVASSMSSLILAQLAESPELLSVFREILSNKGSELYLKNVGRLGLAGTHTVSSLRQVMLRHGCILLGDLDREKYSTFNRPLSDTITLSEEDCLIVLGEE